MTNLVIMIIICLSFWYKKQVICFLIWFKDTLAELDIKKLEKEREELEKEREELEKEREELEKKKESAEVDIPSIDYSDEDVAISNEMIRIKNIIRDDLIKTAKSHDVKIYGKLFDFTGEDLRGKKIDIDVLRTADLTRATISRKEASYYKSMGIDLTGVIIKD